MTSFLITWATHNSRVSERMIQYRVKRGEAIWLDEESEYIVTKVIAEIVEEDELKVLAYNICGDHLHMILVCDREEVSDIVRKLKSQSARVHNKLLGITTTGQAPSLQNDNDSSGACPTVKRGKTQNALWTRKFQARQLTSDEALAGAVEYVRYNRVKHHLEPNRTLHPLIRSMICSYDEAFGE